MTIREDLQFSVPANELGSIDDSPIGLPLAPFEYASQSYVSGYGHRTGADRRNADVSIELQVPKLPRETCSNVSANFISAKIEQLPALWR